MRYSNLLDDVLMELVEEGYIYEEDEDGYNMSQGEYITIADYFTDVIEKSLPHTGFIDDYEALQKMLDDASDDPKMFMSPDIVDMMDEYFFEIDEDTGEIKEYGECPYILKQERDDFMEERRMYLEENGIAI